MTLRTIGSNMREGQNGEITILYSYSTPVAAYVPGRGFLRTTTKYSVSTSTQIGKWLTDASPITLVPQSEIDALIP